MAAPFQRRWSVWAASRRPRPRRQSCTVEDNTDQPTSRAGVVGADPRFRRSPWPAPRWPAAAPIPRRQSERKRGIRPVPGSCLRPPRHRPLICRRRWYGWQDVTTVAPSPSPSPINCVRGRRRSMVGPSRRGLALRACIGAIGVTPYAAGQFTTFELPAYAEKAISGANTFALAYGAGVHGHPLWTRPAQRQILRDAERHPDTARTLAWANDFDKMAFIGATSIYCPARPSSSTAPHMRPTPRFMTASTQNEVAEQLVHCRNVRGPGSPASPPAALVESTFVNLWSRNSTDSMRTRGVLIDHAAPRRSASSVWTGSPRVPHHWRPTTKSGPKGKTAKLLRAEGVRAPTRRPHTPNRSGWNFAALLGCLEPIPPHSYSNEDPVTSEAIGVLLHASPARL